MRRSAADSHSLYQDENQRLEEELRSKVGALKSLSIDIGDEVRNQNALLNDMDDDMSKVRGFLGSTMARLKGITRGGYGRMWCYMFAFTMAVFFFMYVIIRLS